MDRRLFMLLAAAGVADPGRSPVPGLGPEPGQTPSPETVSGLQGSSGDPQFDAWLQSFYKRSVLAGWSEPLLQQQLMGLTPDPRVTALDGRQPELSKPIGDYMRTAVSDRTVATGRAKMADVQAWLPAIQDRFGAPGQILVAIWGEESSFGAVQGDMDVIRSLASLAAPDWIMRKASQIWASAKSRRRPAAARLARERITSMSP